MISVGRSDGMHVCRVISEGSAETNMPQGSPWSIMIRAYAYVLYILSAGLVTDVGARRVALEEGEKVSHGGRGACK